MAVISVRNLVKTYRVQQKPEGLRASLKALFWRQYKHIRAVDGISFEVEPGEMVGFLGPNGAGKTTTLKMLSGLIFPSGGELQVMGFVPQERSNVYRRQFALLMGQKNQLWWDLPAAESFELHKVIYSIDERQFSAVLGELTDLLSVSDLLHQPVRELSLGERMKLELIAALLHSPKVLFLDEPTIGLDVIAQASIRRCLREYNREKKITMILTTHYMQDIEALCDRVIVINQGRIVHDGSLSEIVERLAGHKVVTIQFHDGQMPPGIESFGDVTDFSPPRVTMRWDRRDLPERAAKLLAEYQIDDISLEDPPIEEVIAEMYRTGLAGLEHPNSQDERA